MAEILVEPAGAENTLPDDLGEMLALRSRERLEGMGYGEFDAFPAGLPAGPGYLSPDLEGLMETLWYFFHVHHDVRDD